MPSIKSLLPAATREWARHYRQYRIAAVAWRSLLEAEAGTRHRAVDPGEPAPEAVVSRTALMRPGDLEYKSRARVFHATGMTAMASLLRATVAAGLELSRAEAAFELGCGGARLIRHLRGVEGLRLVGSDAIEANVDWCRKHVPGIEFHANELQPPLEFVEAETFDLAFAYSVFTHVPMEFQRPWIAELARILKPGGIAVVTILGPDMARTMMAPEDLAAFEHDGSYTMDPDHPRVSHSSALIGSWDVFMSEARMRAEYEPELDVVSLSGGAQSIVTLRKPG